MRTWRWLFSLPVILASPPAGAAPAPPPPLRIGLDKFFRHSTTLLLSGDRAFTVQDAASGKVLLRGTPGTTYQVTCAKDGATVARTDTRAPGTMLTLSSPLLTVPEGSSLLKIARLDNRPRSSLAIRWHRYRGSLTLRREADDTLRVVNTVDVEPYLYGVLPAEIGTHVPLESLKAQAVAARTFALKNRGRFESEGFDLDDTTRSEGYLGADGETPVGDAAVDATRGQVLVYDRTLIDAPFSTDSGGMTACDLTGQCPYLQAVHDGPEGATTEYAADGKEHTWSKTYTPAELAAALAKDPRTQVVQFVSLAIDGLDASGRITTATVAGADGTLKTVTGPQLRQILGYDVFRSTRVTLTVTPEGNYQFDGRGWGHGLGMSQMGAIAMAAPPYKKSYKEILRHYYVGTEISDLATARPVSLARHEP